MGFISRINRRLGDDRGQGLVEYALIISVVALGTISALVFLRDDIKGLFSKAGSSIRLADGAGPPSTGSGSFPPAVTTGIPTGSGNGVWAPTGVAGNPNPTYDLLAGVYTNNEPSSADSGDSCAGIPVGSTTTGATWIWIDHGDLPSVADWVVSGTNYDWACVDPAAALAAGWNLPPWPVSMTIANGGGTLRRPDAGDVITITFSEAITATSICQDWNGASIAGLVLIDNNAAGGGDDEFLLDEINPPGSGNTCPDNDDLNFGDIDLGGNAYVTVDTTFNATISLGGATGTTLTITLGAAFPGSGASTQPGSTTATYDPDGDIEDTSGLDATDHNVSTATGGNVF